MIRKWEMMVFAFLHPRHWTWKLRRIDAVCGCRVYEWLCFSVEFIAKECWRYGEYDRED